MKFYLFLICILCHAQTWASSSASSHAPHINWWHLGSAYKYSPAIGWLTISFLIFVGILIKVIKKPLSLFFQARARDIKEQIEESTKLKQESLKLLKECEERLANMDKELASLKQELSEQIDKEKQEILRKAQSIQEKIKKDTENMINTSLVQAKNKFAREIIESALKKVEADLKKDPTSLNELLNQKMLSDIKNANKEMVQ